MNHVRLQLLPILLVGCLLATFSCKTTNNTIVNSDSYAQEIANHRAEYKAEFLKDERSPLRTPDFKYMHFYEPDATFDCDCTFVRTENAKPFEMATVSGKTQIYTKYGVATCPIGDLQITVNIYGSMRVQAMPGYADHLFIPYKDHTSGEETYGGGRYLDISKKDIANGHVNIDFNKSYNPWCMYSDGYNCPIPPKENHLAIEINAGEKTWTGVKKH